MGKLPAYCFGGIPVDSIKQSAFRMKILTPKFSLKIYQILAEISTNSPFSGVIFTWS